MLLIWAHTQGLEFVVGGWRENSLKGTAVPRLNLPLQTLHLHLPLQEDLEEVVGVLQFAHASLNGRGRTSRSGRTGDDSTNPNLMPNVLTRSFNSTATGDRDQANASVDHLPRHVRHSIPMARRVNRSKKVFYWVPNSHGMPHLLFVGTRCKAAASETRRNKNT